MKRRLGFGVIAALAITASAASARADDRDDGERPSLSSVCRSFPCIYDQNGRGAIVGIGAGDFRVKRKIGDTWYELAINQQGLLNNLLVYYTSSNCTGQPYFNDIQIPLFAWYDGTSIWIPVGSPISAMYHSYAYGNPLFCTASDSFGNVPLQAAAKGETKTFYIPLKEQ